MQLILIVCQNVNIQKFYVTNLVVRGYHAIGVLALADQDQMFWDSKKAELALMWGELPQLEKDVSVLRQHAAEAIPVIIISRDRPAAEWLMAWQIAAHMPYLADSRQLIAFLQPWLKPIDSQTLQTGNHTQR